MVRTTEHVPNRRLRPLVMLAVLALIAIAAVAMSGCTKAKSPQGSAQTGSSVTTSGMSAHMSGAPVNVYIAQEVVDSRRPAPWNLRSPQSAITSYLAWVSYAYRIGNSQVATPTMTSYEEVRMDSYCQYNLENKRLLDQKLDSISFGKASKTATATLVPVKESWTYSYLSVDKGNPVIGGPYRIDYQSTYKVVKNAAGQWIVDSVNAKALGTLK